MNCEVRNNNPCCGNKKTGFHTRFFFMYCLVAPPAEQKKDVV